jgi:hypothetical protein
MKLECVLLSIDGEYYADDQEYFSDNQDPQEQYEQDKYNMGIPYCPIHSLLSYSLFN